MSRMLKIIGIAAGAVILLLVGALVAIGFLIDPNDYKDDITAAVNKATGRQLTLEGDLELALFPRLRLAVGAAEISNAAGFGDEPFARIGSAELSVELWPLLSRRIAINEARLTGLELNLARDARGRNNWQDLGAGATPAPAAEAAAPAESGSGADLSLDVGAVEVADARVTWTDAGTGSRWVLDDFALEASDLGPERSFPLSVAFALANSQVQVAVDSDMQATISLAANTYRLDDLRVKLAGSGEAWPGGEGEARLQFESFAANLGAETIELTGLKLDFIGITMKGSLSGQRLLSDLSLSGAVDIEEFDPQAVLKVFDIAIVTADPDVLRRASAKANLVYSSTQLGMRDMSFTLDDSVLTGRIGLENERLRYNLAVNEINVDRYLPPAEEGEAAAAAEEEGSLDEVDLPLEALRALDAAGDLRFDKAQFAGLTLTDTAFALTAQNGRLELTPRARLYGGTLTGTIRVAVQDNAARINVTQQLDDVSLAPLGTDLIDSDAITGTGDVRLDLVATGTNLGEMRRGLDGDVSFNVTDGSLEGIDAWYELRRARAVFGGDPVPDRGNAPRRTTFSSLSASGVVEDAILTNRDLNGTLDFMRIDGTGTVNLLTDAINFDLRATFVDGPTLQSDPGLARLAGDSVPLRATGTLAAPELGVNFTALVSEQIGNEVDEAVEEQRSEVNQELEEARDEARESVRERLRGILDR